MLELPDFSKIQAAVVAYPEATFIIFATGLGLGWGAASLLARRELKVNRSIIEAVRAADISPPDKQRILDHSLPQRSRLKFVIQSLALVVLVAAIGAVGIYFVRSSLFADLMGRMQGSAEAKLYFQCDWTIMPKTMPSPGEIFVVEPHSPNMAEQINDAGGTERLFAPIGSPMIWSTKGDDKFFQGYKCQTFNYGSGPLFVVSLFFKVFTRSVVKNVGGGQQTGDRTQSGQWIVSAPKIDEGSASPFVFYFINRFRPYFVEIDLPPTATSVRSNNGNPQPIEVISAAHGQPIFLNPADIGP